MKKEKSRGVVEQKQPELEQRFILLFDGACALCQHTSHFFLKRSLGQALFFASLQGNYAKKVFEVFPELMGEDSFVFVTEKGGKIESYALRSTALLELLKLLNIFPFLSFLLRITPRFLRDFVYRLCAMSRKFFSRLFVKRACSLPTPEEAKRLLP